MTRPQYFAYRLSMTYRLAAARWRRLRSPLPPYAAGRRALDRLFQVLDLVGVFDLYEAVTNTVLLSTRALAKSEIELLRPVFGETVNYRLIRVDERAWIGPRQRGFYYVSFHTVNAWGAISPPTLIHEIVHVWQYTRWGAAYIPRALHAQTTPEGYDYGGLAGLERNRQLEDFNYEQQADVIEDFFRLANGYPAQWVAGRGAEVLPYYYPYVDELTRPAP